MSTLFVIRHAEPSVQGVILGQSDPPLSEAGRQTAAAIRLRIPVSAVYCSPLRRAVETAAFLTPHPIVLTELAEISYGRWDGLTWQEIEKRYPETARKKLQRWQEITPPRGEKWLDFHRRILWALEQIRTGPMPSAIVAHEAVNAVIYQVLTLCALESYEQHYCEIREYEF